MTAQRATLLDVVERFFTPTLLAKVVSDGIESGEVELATFEDLEVLAKLAGMAEYTQGMRLLRLVDGAVGSVEYVEPAPDLGMAFHLMAQLHVSAGEALSLARRPMFWSYDQLLTPPPELPRGSDHE